MNKIFKFFLLFFLSTQLLFAVSNRYYQEKFDTTKKLYLGAVMSNKKDKEIVYLKKLIIYGDKLKKNTIKYKRELNRLDKTISVSKAVTTKFHLKPKINYNIKSIKQTKNSIIVEFNKNINKSYLKFSEKKIKNYFYDYFDFKGNFKDARPTKLHLDGIARVKVSQLKKDVLRIYLKNKKNPKTVYIINKNKIIIKLLNQKRLISNKNKVVQKRYNNKKTKVKKAVKVIPNDILYPSTNKTIVIDAGHGGKDAGAVGIRKRYEKNIVLNITKYLSKELKARGFKVHLTRSKDKFVRLSNRTKFANRKKADMFISIHANAARKSRAKVAHGVESYFLSPARSARAKRVAALENKGDIKKMGYSSKNSLLTILNQGKITASNKMAIDIQKNMLYNLRKRYGTKAIRDGGVREGPFWVLVGAQMPSVLIEVGYISHPTESKRINTKEYQKLIAHGIANGIQRYFMKN
ncbi:MAG: N-acetylmuramoyl-L-alanine amidase [Campylobacterota bacterium]|nr:N-acetylmuramoyl-L-alanine amidase [Campylobacterota bacterium]